ncbi:MAG: hypothetical protein AB7L66_00525 [Gemmatimonadales bacterium]
MRVRSLLLKMLPAIIAGLGAGRPAAVAAQSPARWVPSLQVTAGTALGRTGSNWGAGGALALIHQGSNLGFGVEAGYQGFGTETVLIQDFNLEPGAVLQEDVSRSHLRAVGLVRFQAGTGRVRPYFLGGAGVYLARFRDRIEVRDPAGQRVPFYDFYGTGHDLKPGFTGGVGLALHRTGRGPAVALEGRWHGIVALGEDGFESANFLTFGVVFRR